MAKKKKNNSLSAVSKIMAVSVGALIVGVLIFKGAVYFLGNSKYFNVQKVTLDSSLQFIHKKDFPRLKGKNIYSIDLAQIQKRLHRKYPQISDLRVTRKFPDQILILAKKRKPFMQIEHKSDVYVLDENGIILSVSQKENKKLPILADLGIKESNFRLGSKVNKKEIQMALRINKSFNVINALSAYDVKEIQIETLSKIKIFLNTGLFVIIDGYQLEKKMNVLSVVLTQGKLNWKEIKYVDLRFKDPVIGKKQ